MALDDPQPAKRPAIQSLRLLLPYLRPYALRVAGATTALLIAAGLVLGLGQGVRQLIDRGFGHGSAAELDTAALGMFAVVALLAVATYSRYYLVSWLGERVAADLRRDVFNKVLTLSPDFFETARTGDILSRMTADVAVLQALTGSAISQWVRSVLMTTGALTMLVITSSKLAGIVVVVVPVVIVPVILFGRCEKKLSKLQQERIADLGAQAEETVSFMRTVQAFTHEAIDRRNYAAATEAFMNVALRRIRVRAILILIVIMLGFGAITFSLWVGGRDVLAGRITGGELSAFVFYAILVATSGATISELWGEVQRAAGAADRVLELLAERPGIVTAPVPTPFPSPVVGRIEFADVDFRYPARPAMPALDGVSFSIAPGEMVALVGPSGAGKTTVMQLLLRFYDPQSGRITVDGIDIASADPTALRRLIAQVAQDPVIFSTNARENIRYGRPDATDDEVHAAAEAAAADFIADLPQGFDTFLGEKGVRLSGGQRQRIAIARAILRDSPILLLDEATSALDAESERAVQHALAVLAVNRTTLVIAHRLATVRRADRIIVMDQGRIVAIGRHDDLVTQGGLYAHLASLQFGPA